jgi:hypothetical protein
VRQAARRLPHAGAGAAIWRRPRRAGRRPCRTRPGGCGSVRMPSRPAMS